MHEINILQSQCVGSSFVHWNGAEGKVTHLKEDSEFPPVREVLIWET